MCIFLGTLALSFLFWGLLCLYLERTEQETGQRGWLKIWIKPLLPALRTVASIQEAFDRTTKPNQHPGTLHYKTGSPICILWWYCNLRCYFLRKYLTGDSFWQKEESTLIDSVFSNAACLCVHSDGMKMMCLGHVRLNPWPEGNRWLELIMQGCTSVWENKERESERRSAVGLSELRRGMQTF